ncbi:hypothetical protein NCER_100320 [Vairimorpha ceranae BRL01]|uniref:DUF5096 domain-containing protein n=2 Tax=Vairimorpha ceranae TaxID=40302 RepID=C4V799_VAIC1|nr:hypothetical protein AAJ76_2600041420 [Vairimorpha ceranae]EEQ82904.1 hypothetical protein NCER_100320 [Vairimorpha ceranae BRL01]KAF5139917.1 hypothetical protein G9O61_00g019360 [Vairimorpha ceranae]KKO75279.1 hypothetical protein AAJ76_2600041420 [Vairimorpha ceranae]
MEDFVGYRMKFRIHDKEVIGTLKCWNSDREEVIIKSDDKEEVVDIGDISDLEICELKEEKCKEVLKEQVDNSKEQTSVSKEMLKEQKDNRKEECIEQINISTEECTIQANTNLLNITPQLIPSIGIISLSQYYSFLNDCFTLYGPTKEEFCTSVSLSIFKVLKSRISSKEIMIKLGTNTLYNCIGYILGRLLLVKGYSVGIQEGKEDIEVQPYKFIFYNNFKENIVSNKVCVNLSEEYIENYDLVFGVNSKYPNCINLMLGCVIEECQNDGEGYLIDINASNKVYEKYKVRKIFDKTGIIRYHKKEDY